MLKNYLKIAVRNLIKRRVTSFVNLLGLSIGITTTILLFLYARYELTYDDFHEDTDNTYRLLRTEDLGDNAQLLAKTSPRVMLTFLEEFPEAKHSTALFKRPNEPLLSIEENGVYEKDFLFADSSFFDVFGFELIKGDPKSVLTEPFSVVLTEKMAEKYFGNEEPVGQTLRYELRFDLVVTGVVRENSESGSHFHFDFLASKTSLSQILNYDLLYGDFNGFYNYFTLNKGTDVSSFNKKYQAWVQDRFPKQKLEFQAIKDIHLRSEALAEIQPQSDIMFVRVVVLIGIVVIILATINYINSAVSSSVERLKEMGMRMVSGAFGPHIFAQFILEALLTILMAVIISFAAIYFSLGPFNELLNTQLIIDFKAHWRLWSLICLMIFTTGIISGVAPAIVILRMELTDVLLNVVTMGRIGYLRKGLMIFQFIVSIILIVGAVTINRQAAFVKSKDLGFEQQGVMVIPIRDRGVHMNFESFKDKVMAVAGVSSVARGMSIPGKPFNSEYFQPELGGSDSIMMNKTWIGDDYFETLGMELLAGIDFDESKSTQFKPVIVNETVVTAFELGEPFEAVNKPLYHDGHEYRIIAVVRDFNYETLHKRIQPLVIEEGANMEDFMLLRFQSKNSDLVTESVSNVWYKTAYEQPFTSSLLTNDMSQMYLSEKIWGDIGNLSMLVSVMIGGLGVFGLVSLVVQKRFKEIGIRKVFGASNSNIIGLVYHEFFAILLISFVISSPLGFYLASLWLQDFAYRITVPYDAFLIAIALLSGVTCIAVLFHSLRVLAKKPINALND